jgi:NMD protein affecting ribosome stability and mRNA decay
MVRLMTMCEECGRRLEAPINIPSGFRLICYDCYVDFKNRRPPSQMHYHKKPKC